MRLIERIVGLLPFFFSKDKKKIKEKTQRRSIGDIGEDIACRSLSEQGYVIRDRNARISHKELDIIAEDDEHVVIVEVKTLSLTRRQAEQERHRASEQIDREKAKNLLSAAKAYTSRNYNGKITRIDVIEVYLGGSEPEIVHIENAVTKATLNRHRR